MSVSVQAFSVFRFAGMGNGLKSTQEQQERKQKCASQVDFFEKQKQNLKHMECTTLEEIARKLEMFHSYEDQIAAAKQQFNNSQMGHVLDEAKEIGEKIAEEAEKTAPKTPEEREKDRIEEATGSEEENDGMLSEVLDEISEMAEELQEELQEELEEELKDGIAGEESIGQLEEMQEENQAEELQEDAAVPETMTIEDSIQAVRAKMEQDRVEQAAERRQQNALERARIFRTEDAFRYQHIDYRT